MNKEKTAAAWQAVRKDLTDVHSKLAQLEAQISSLENVFESMEEPEVEAGRVQMNLKSIARIVAGLSSLKSQEEILSQLLEESEPFVDRAVIFVRKDSTFFGWKGVGIDEETVDEIRLSEARDPVVEAARSRRIIQVEGNLQGTFTWLQDEDTAERRAVCIPFMFQDYVPAVFYGDAQRALELGSLEILIQLTTLVLQNQFLSYMLQPVDAEEGMRWPSLETREAQAHSTPGPAPSAGPAMGVATSQQPEDLDGLAVEREAAPVIEESAEGANLAPPENELEPEALELDLDEEFPLESSEEVEAMKGLDLGDLDDALRAADFEDELELDEAGLLTKTLDEELDLEPSFGSPEDEAIEEESLHAEARRLARLLATEIKLYNEDGVLTGRQSGDIYSRLQADIDRSWEMYSKRVHPLVQSQVDYFNLELVRILAQDDEDLMGADYPGERLSTAEKTRDQQEN